MGYGKIDLQNYDYLIVYRDENGNISTWTLPEGSFQMNYTSMMKRGVVLRVYKKMSDADLLDVIINK